MRQKSLSFRDQSLLRSDQIATGRYINAMVEFSGASQATRRSSDPAIDPGGRAISVQRERGLVYSMVIVAFLPPHYDKRDLSDR